MSNDTGDMIFLGIGVIILFAIICWVRHLMWSIILLASDTGSTAIGKIILAAIGTFIPPIGAVHGFMIFFGITA